MRRWWKFAGQDPRFSLPVSRSTRSRHSEQTSTLDKSSYKYSLTFTAAATVGLMTEMSSHGSSVEDTGHWPMELREARAIREGTRCKRGKAIKARQAREVVWTDR